MVYFHLHFKIAEIPIVYIIAVWEVQYGQGVGNIADLANKAELVDDSAESFILLVFDELGMRLGNKHLKSINLAALSEACRGKVDSCMKGEKTYRFIGITDHPFVLLLLLVCTFFFF